MANWMNGTIQINGIDKNVKKFYESLVCNVESLQIEETVLHDDVKEIKCKPNVWLENMCIESITISECTMTCYTRARSSFDVDLIKSIGEEYSIDIIIFANDYLAGTMQIIRVLEGNIEVNYVGKDKSLTYSYESQ